MDVIAPLIGVLLGGLLGWGGTLLAGRQQGEHARAGFARERRSEAYIDALRAVALLMEWVEDTLPVFGPKQTQPPYSQQMDDGLRLANARLEAWGSPEVLALATAWRDASTEFRAQALTTFDIEAQSGAPSPTDRITVETRRQVARDRVKALRERIRTELQGTR